MLQRRMGCQGALGLGCDARRAVLELVLGVVGPRELLAHLQRAHQDKNKLNDAARSGWKVFLVKAVK